MPLTSQDMQSGNIITRSLTVRGNVSEPLYGVSQTGQDAPARRRLPLVSRVVTQHDVRLSASITASATLSGRNTPVEYLSVDGKRKNFHGGSPLHS